MTSQFPRRVLKLPLPTQLGQRTTMVKNGWEKLQLFLDLIPIPSTEIFCISKYLQYEVRMHTNEIVQVITENTQRSAHVLSRVCLCKNVPPAPLSQTAVKIRYAHFPSRPSACRLLVTNETRNLLFPSGRYMWS